MDNKNSFTKLTGNLKQRREQTKSPPDNPQNTETTSTSPPDQESKVIEKKKGRPPHGKRSNPEWVGRTYYIEKNVDLDVAEQLLRLKRQGINIDKSELVNFLLSEWTKYQQGEKATFQIGENIKK